MSDYTPTPMEVRAHWCGGARMRKGAEFDRMIAAIEREAAARALEEYAIRPEVGVYAADLMRARAAEIREEK